MKKILNIGGNDIAFESNGVTPFLYKKEFHKDYFGDLMKLAKALGNVQDLRNLSKVSFEDLDHVDLSVITQFVWACAKTADMNNTPPLLQWLMANPEYDVFTDGLEIVRSVLEGLQTSKKFPPPPQRKNR